VDYFVEMASSKNLYIIFAPTWGNWIAGDYYMQDLSAIIFNENNAYEYGFFLGDRYRQQNNILWSLGGDRDATGSGNDYRPVIRALAEGIADGINNTYGQDGSSDYTDIYMSFHGQKNSPNSSEYFHGEDWLGYNQLQEDMDGQYVDILDDFSLTPVLPTFMLEGYYEERDGYTPWQIRIQAYQTVFSGGFGHVYGHQLVYGFNSTSTQWFDQLDDPGAVDMQYLYDLMTGVLNEDQLLTRKPAQYLIDGDTGGTDGTRTSATSNRITATTDEDSSFALVYSANGRDIPLYMNRLHGNTMSAYWLNPRNGKWQVSGTEYDQMQAFNNAVNTGADAPSLTFDPPGVAESENDWVLLLLLNESRLNACFEVQKDPGENFKVNLDASCSTPAAGEQITAYAWDFGDGNTAAGQKVSHTYASAGEYDIRLVVTGESQNTDASIKHVVIDEVTTPPPEACFTTQLDSTKPYTVKFDGACSQAAQGHTITSYEWNFGDGNSKTGGSVSHTYSSSGGYEPELIVTDDLGNTGASTQQINLEEITLDACFDYTIDSAIAFKVHFDGGCTAPPVIGNIENYQWSFGDGAQGSDSSITHTYNETGEYTVKLKITANHPLVIDSTSQTVQITGVSNTIPGAAPNNPFELFPNPASGWIQIVLDNNPTGKVTLNLFTLDGKTMDTLTRMVEGNELSLNVSAYPKGFYILQIRWDSQTATKKIQIE
jgi:PKD repeat protein